MTDQHTRVLIIGSGPAGYTAAIYAARAGLEPTLVTGMTPGGQLTITTDVENFPGFAQTIQGPWLMEQMRDQALHVGTNIVYDYVQEVDFSKRPFVCTTTSGTRFLAETVVISTGAQALKAKQSTAALVCRDVRPVTDFSFAAKKSPLWAVVTLPLRKHFI
jgi:thioredoxin reductase (NADPH)